MEHKISLFSFKFNLENEDLVNRLIAKRYKKEGVSGFVMSKVNDNFIKAKHIHRLEVVKTVYDPFGDIVENKYFDYIVNEFALVDGFIEIFNQARNLSFLRRELLSLLNNDCTISNISIDMDRFIHLSQLKFENMYVEAVELNTYNLFDDSFTKVNVKGNKQLLSNMSAFRENTPHEIIKLTLHVDSYKIEVNNRGTVKIVSNFIDPSFNDSISSILKQSISH